MHVLEKAARKAAQHPIHANSFCCGLTLQFGTRVVLLLHLVLVCYFIVAAAGHMIWQDTSYSYTRGEGLVLETLLAGFSLVGVATILGALWGTHVKNAVLVRVYWYYMFVSFLLLLVWTIKEFLFKSPCKHLPHFIEREYGYAWTCGVFRIWHIVAVVMLIFVPIYLMLIVLSYADDVTFGVVGPQLGDLMSDRKHFDKPWLYDRQRLENKAFDPSEISYAMPEDPRGRIDRGGQYGAVYDKICASGLGGSTRLFGGKFHDVEYPREK